MVIHNQKERQPVSESRQRPRWSFALATGGVLVLLSACGGNNTPPLTTGFVPPTSNFCTATADNLFSACEAEAVDDLFTTRAICINVSDATLRGNCFAMGDVDRTLAQQTCSAQQGLRRDTCVKLGQTRYDPAFNPSNFDATLATPNPYFPMTVGNVWEYAGGSETNTITVLTETKLIQGITARVFKDEVFDDGALVEDTDDWFAQTTTGDVWYLGEEVKDYESFAGDNPMDPELVKIDGSFKSGRDGDKGGLFFPFTPTVNQIYLEEFSLGNAEDVTEILSINYTFSGNANLDRYVPAAVANVFCTVSAPCIVTLNYSLLEPGKSARKYFAGGVGFIIETDPAAPSAAEGGLKAQLVNCNFDTDCVGLPQP